MKITSLDQLREGMRVKCVIEHEVIEDARISIQTGYGSPNYYICQNEVSGNNGAPNDYGYKYSWVFDGIGALKGFNLESAEGIEAAQIGDVILDEDGNRCGVVLEVFTQSVLLSDEYERDYLKAGSWYTFAEMANDGWTIEEQEEDVQEVSMDEVAKALGKSVDKIRIKKD